MFVVGMILQTTGETQVTSSGAWGQQDARYTSPAFSSFPTNSKNNDAESIVCSTALLLLARSLCAVSSQ